MSKQLYRVDVEVRVYVAADSPAEACEIGLDGAIEEMKDGHGTASAELEQHGVERVWANAFPYGSRGMTPQPTCQQMFDTQQVSA